jgi:hypothetical protein
MAGTGTPLPRRHGPRPATTPTNPHTQLDQQPVGTVQRDRLEAALFAHLHPGADESLHAMLPPALAEEAIEAGWAERHPVAARGLIPGNAVMLYAPRDDAERAVVEGMIRAAHRFARGEGDEEVR